MAAKQPIAERNLDGYGAPVIPWAKVRETLEEGWTQRPASGGPGRHTCWLATARPDGTPHVMPLGARWVDGAFYFTAGVTTRKAQNLVNNPHCVITVATRAFDLVVEGEAAMVTDEAGIERIGDLYKSQGWQPSVRNGALVVGGEFSAPSAGPSPWNVYEVIPATVFAFGAAEPYGATRWHLQ